MPHRMTPAQYRSKMRQAVSNYNREVNRINNANKRAVEEYNRKARAHNQKVRSQRQKRLSELRQLRSKSKRNVKVRYVTFYSSVETLHQSFVRLEGASEQGSWLGDSELFDMAEAETANSVAVLNALLAEPAEYDGDGLSLGDTSITTELRDINPDLDERWQGALYALSPRNPDAARQFCTSAREILVNILDLKAPDKDVLAVNPKVELTQNNRVTRREKIYYCLTNIDQDSAELADFINEDINNVMNLFATFNPATHGEAGRYDLVQLSAIKERVEGAIKFLHRIVTMSSTT